MKVIETVEEMQSISDYLRSNGKKISFVPTMGFLHEGHISLIRKASELSTAVIVSIFVNPMQFAPNEDFEDYPRDFERDKKLAEENGADYIFAPSVSEMYPNDYHSEVKVNGITEKFEGASRPTHFNGVTTVVSKLFNATNPHLAVFGQKDYQQALVIMKMVKDLNFDIDIVLAPIAREEDGLARSSRNIFLSQDLRNKAPVIYQSLEEARKAVENGERNRKMINAVLHKTLRSVPEIRIDYACAVDANKLSEPDNFNPRQRIVFLIAAYLGKTRLIDNALLTVPANE